MNCMSAPEIEFHNNYVASRYNLMGVIAQCFRKSYTEKNWISTTKVSFSCKKTQMCENVLDFSFTIDILL